MLKVATVEDVITLTTLLKEMNEETEELQVDPVVTTQTVFQSFSEGVSWFLFQDEDGEIFGTCHIQSVYSYWRLQKRYYLGGFYIRPSHRGRGLFQRLVKELKDYTSARGSVQLYAHIHEENKRSWKAFTKSGFQDEGYKLLIQCWDEKNGNTVDN